MNFVAIDVETANESWSSVCQIGLARYTNGSLVDTWSSLVDPGEEFTERNIAIHKITPSRVAGAPTFASLHPTLLTWLSGAIVVSHSRSIAYRSAGRARESDAEPRTARGSIRDASAGVCGRNEVVKAIGSATCVTS